MTTVSARKLLDVIRELPYQTVTLEDQADSRLLVHAGRARFELQTIPPEDFPHLNFHESAEFVRCDTSLLRTAVEKRCTGFHRMTTISVWLASIGILPEPTTAGWCPAMGTA